MDHGPWSIVHYELELPPIEPLPPLKPPEEGDVTPEPLEPLEEPPLGAPTLPVTAEPDPVPPDCPLPVPGPVAGAGAPVCPDPPVDPPVGAPTLPVTAEPAPLPPDWPETALRRPTTRLSGGGGVVEDVPPVMRVPAL